MAYRLALVGVIATAAGIILSMPLVRRIARASLRDSAGSVLGSGPPSPRGRPPSLSPSRPGPGQNANRTGVLYAELELFPPSADR